MSGGNLSIFFKGVAPKPQILPAQGKIDCRCVRSGL
jgi:hypothetical protein